VSELKLADEMTTMAPQDEPAPKGAKGRGGMAGSSKGKILIGAVLLLAVVVAAVAVFLLSGQSKSADDTSGAVTTANAAASTAATASASASEPAQAPAEVPLDDVFTFRDIFVSLVQPESNPQSSDTSTATNGTTPETSAGTILLQDITVENGEPTAVLVWNGTSYSVQEGDQIDGSPWKVLEIRDDSVVMLYGDTQVVLSVGQAISK
jgi:type IV pilus biogenesis protein PilP